MRRLLLLALLAVPGAARAADPNAVIGRWWTENKDGVVELYTCPAGLCGREVGVTGWRPDGSAPLDHAGHSHCHLLLIPDGKVDDDGIWDSHITNPDDGKTYTITLQVEGDGRLRMRGYIGLPIFGQTIHWTRFAGRVTPDCHIQG